jgi:tRNA-splicing ligase RtcB
MHEDWSFCEIVKKLKDKAWGQLGTSGSGNHFVEFGKLTILDESLGLPQKEYLALLSHSGSRGTGYVIASHYSRLARALHKELPKHLAHLAWLDLDCFEGQEYWQAMELMGRYASANHELIHNHIVKHLGVDIIFDIENHHNFAWKEILEGKEVIVHRKGATPANKDSVGIILSSMATPGYVVSGKGNPDSINSTAHGAGRRMSRKQAKKQYKWSELRDFLEKRGVTLMCAGLDEIPYAYKDIEEVMKAQKDLVTIHAKYEPRLVKMAPGHEKPED